MVTQVNIVTLGHVDHGKTMLAAAISAYAAKLGRAKTKRYNEIDAAPEEMVNRITVNASHVRYETEERHYDLIDCPRHEDYVKYLITGSAQVDAAILVVSATDGPMPQTYDQIRLAQQVKIPHLVVYLNKCDQKELDDKEGLMLMEDEIRDLLVKYGYPHATRIVRGSALKALNEVEGEFGVESIRELLDVLDHCVPNPSR